MEVSRKKIYNPNSTESVNERKILGAILQACLI